MSETMYCDNCGEPVAIELRRWYHELPVSVASANAGESAVLCPSCAQLADRRDETGLLRAAGLL